MSPVQNRLAPGEEPFAVFVATGEAGVSDLFAVRADGGTTFPITYTRVREMAPALSPTGTDLAFIREGVRDDPSSRHVVVMNLLNGAERVIRPVDTPPDAVAWSDDATQLFVRAGSATLVAAGSSRRSGAPCARRHGGRARRLGVHGAGRYAGVRSGDRLSGRWRVCRAARRRAKPLLRGRPRALPGGEVIQWATSSGRGSSSAPWARGECANSGSPHRGWTHGR